MFRPFVITLSALVSTTLAGCSDPATNGGTHVTGTIDGKNLDLNYALSGVLIDKDIPSLDVVVLSNKPDLCAKLEGGGVQNEPDFQMLFFGLSDVDLSTGATSLPKGTGTFEVWSSKSPSLPKTSHIASVFYNETDAAGKALYDGLVLGTTGTISLDAMGAQNAFAGKGDFSLDTGDALKINYDATPCAALSTFNPSSSGTMPPPPTDPQSAWFFSFVDGGANCPLASHQTSVGMVDANKATQYVVNGQGGATVDCNVAAVSAGSYHVFGSATDASASGLAIEIPELSTQATKANPAIGTVSYTSIDTGGNWWGGSNTCSFYFVDGSPEAVSDGKFWVAFTCSDLAYLSYSQCTAAESYAIFDGCGTTF